MKKTIFIQLVFLLLTTTVFSQTDFMVSVKKAGKLQKCLKKKNWLNVEKLKIEGILNCDDIAFIASLPKIKSLNLEGAYYVNNEKSEYRDSYLKTLSITGVNNLLYTPGEKINKIIYLHIPCIPTLEELVLPEDLLFIADKMHLKKLTFAHRSYLPYIDSKIEDIVGTNNDKFEIYSIESDEFLNSKHNLSTDTLDFNRYNCSRYSRFVINETFLVGRDGYGKTKTMLAHWKDSLDIAILGQVDSILPGAFKDSKMQDLRLPDNITELKSNFISGWESLRTIDLNQVTHLGRKAFNKCANLTNIISEKLVSIEDSVFIGTNITSLTLPTSLKEINKSAFVRSKIKKVYFLGNTPPQIFKYTYDYGRKRKDYYTEKANPYIPIEFFIPQGSSLNYYKDAWSKIPTYEPEVEEDYCITLNKPGNINTFLTEKIIFHAKKIKVEGHLYIEDFLQLDKCKNLKSLDLSNAYITEDIEKKIKEAKYNKKDDLFGTELYGLDAVLANKATEEEVADAYAYKEKLWDDYIKKLSEAEVPCVLPECKYNSFTNLEEVIYPKILQTVRLVGPYVKKSILPEHVKTIEKFSCNDSIIVIPESVEEIHRGAFEYCDNAKQIILPKSWENVVKFYSNLFTGCDNLKCIDLNNLRVKTFYISSYYPYPTGLEEMRFPETLEKIVISQERNWERGKNWALSFYFKSSKAPEGILDNNFIREGDTVYIPKGSLAGWLDIISKSKATFIEIEY